MKTDKIFYTLFQVFPELLFQLLGESPKLGDGNELDQNAFPEMMREFEEEWQGEEPEVYVIDASFYTQENLRDFQYSIRWISRVPLTIQGGFFYLFCQQEIST